MNGNRFVLMTPVLAHAQAFAEPLRSALAGASPAAIVLRLAPAPERDLVNAVKLLAPIGQTAGAAILVAVAGEADLVAVAVRGGADGVHAGGADVARLRAPLSRDNRILGAADVRSRHDAMEAGEAGADYVMFGEPRADGSAPPVSATLERAAWWAEIFETPCIAFANTLDDVPALAATGAEFVGLGDAIWQDAAGPEAAMRRAATLLPLDAAA